MSQPPPKPTPPARLVVPNTSRQERLLAIGAGITVLALIVLGFIALSRVPGSPSTNQLTGTIVAKHSRGEREQEISVGRKGLQERETDSGYSFDVKTEPDGRVYEVPVPRVQFGMYEVGAKYKFIRPASEQK